MKALTITLGAAVFSGTLALSSLAWAQACCAGTPGGQMAGDMAGHAGHGMAQITPVGQTTGSRQVFMQPVQSVFDNYFKIQSVLAQDSLAGVNATATAMAKAIRGDSMKMLAPKVAEQAEALAKAQNLLSARLAFKALSDSLIQYEQAQKLPPGTYFEVYCPMAKASWLQTNKTIMNPYMGPGMVHCGQIKS